MIIVFLLKRIYEDNKKNPNIDRSEKSVRVKIYKTQHYLSASDFGLYQIVPEIFSFFSLYLKHLFINNKSSQRLVSKLVV